MGIHAVIGVLAAVLLSAGCGGQSYDSLMAAAKTNMDKGEFRAASIQIKNALQEKPNSPEARYLLGRALLEAGEPGNAEVELLRARELRHSADEVEPLLLRAYLITARASKVIAEAPKAPVLSPAAKSDVATYVGAAHFALGDNKAAAKALTEALALRPDSRVALLASARLRVAEGELEGALQQVEQVLAKAGADTEALRLKGDALVGLKRPDEAIAAYRKAIEARPDFVGAHASLVFTLLSKAAFDPATAGMAEAEKQFAEMRKVASNHPQTLALQGQIEFMKADYRAARETAQKLMRSSGFSPASLQLAGAVEYSLGSLGQAESLLSKALQGAPGVIATRRFLALTYLATGQSAKAIATLQPLLARGEPDAEILGLAGEAHMQARDYRKAEELLVAATKLKPDDPAKRTSLALARLNRGDSDTAFNELEKIAAADRGTVADLALVANLLGRGEHKRALKAIDTLEKKLPKSPTPPSLRGQALLALNDRDGARRSFERALEVSPSYYAAAANLAEIDMAENKPEAAAKRMTGVLAADPKLVQAMLTLSLIKLRLKAPTEEIAALINQAAAADPVDPAPRVALVDFYLAVKDNKKALSAAQDAVNAMPDRPEGYFALAKVQAIAADYNQALSTYGKLAALQPNRPDAHLRAADIHAANKDLPAAAASLRKALAIAPDLVEAQKRLVIYDVASGREQSALAVARSVQKQRPKQSTGYLLEGDVYAARNAWAEAEAAYRAGLKQAPDAELAARLHKALAAGGKAQDAAQFVASWAKNNPKDANFRLLLASAAAAQDDFAAAVPHYRAIIEIQPDNAVVLNNFAWAALQLKLPEALALAEKANKLSPGNAPFMDTLASVLADRGELPRALELLAEASRKAPEMPVIRLHYASVLIKAGRKAEARKELDELVKLGEKFPAQAQVARLVKEL